MTVLAFLLILIVVLFAVWAVRKLLAAFEIGEPISTVVWIIVVLVALYLIITSFIAVTHGATTLQI